MELTEKIELKHLTARVNDLIKRVTTSDNMDASRVILTLSTVVEVFEQFLLYDDCVDVQSERLTNDILLAEMEDN